MLVLNVGVVATPPDWAQVGINRPGDFLISELLKPALLASSTPPFNSRVYSVSSVGHRHGEVRLHDLNFEGERTLTTSGLPTAGQSKAANIYMANEFGKRCGARGLQAFSVYPGGILTSLAHHLDPEVLKQLAENRETVPCLKSEAQPRPSMRPSARTGRHAAATFWRIGPSKVARNLTLYLPTDVRDRGYAPWANDDEKAAKL